MKIVTVLRSGGDFIQEHVQALARQIEQFASPYDLEVLSDLDVPGVVRIPLKHDWPGWWSKIEVMRPDIKGDILYFDLDTVIIGSLKAIIETDRLTVLRDFYRDGVRYPEGLQSSVMFLPAAERMIAWDAWISSPRKHMLKFWRGGDQAFLETLWLNKANRWQDIFPGQFVSYKVHIRGKEPPADARIIVFHGQPRPWAVPEFQHIY